MAVPKEKLQNQEETKEDLTIKLLVQMLLRIKKVANIDCHIILI